MRPGQGECWTYPRGGPGPPIKGVPLATTTFRGKFLAGKIVLLATTTFSELCANRGPRAPDKKFWRAKRAETKVAKTAKIGVEDNA